MKCKEWNQTNCMPRSKEKDLYKENKKVKEDQGWKAKLPRGQGAMGLRSPQNHT